MVGALIRPPICSSKRPNSRREEEDLSPPTEARCCEKLNVARGRGAKNNALRPLFFLKCLALPSSPGGRRRLCATFTKPTRNLIARSNHTMRREIINQGLMYGLISLFVFAMMPLLRLLR